MTATPLSGALTGRKGVGALVMHVDISERKRAEFAKLFAQTDDFMVVLDANGLIETVNPAFTRATGWVSTDERLHAIGMPTGTLADRSECHIRREQSGSAAAALTSTGPCRPFSVATGGFSAMSA